VRVRASVDEIAKSLQGNWRAEHLFALKQALDAFDFIGKRLAERDREIEQQLQSLQGILRTSRHCRRAAIGRRRGGPPSIGQAFRGRSKRSGVRLDVTLLRRPTICSIAQERTAAIRRDPGTPPCPSI
jgi:hypothetical protein